MQTFPSQCQSMLPLGNLMSSTNQDVEGNRSTRMSIGTLLIGAVNLPLAVLLTVLLPLDYQREMENAIAQKHVSLTEEAMTIHQGLSSVSPNAPRESVQQYLNADCAHMQESKSPGHHIAIRWNDSLLQTEGRHRASPEILSAIHHAANSSDHRTSVAGETLVVGSFKGNDMDVYVSEFTINIRRSIQREILLHLGSLAALAVAAAAIVNLVLWRIVTSPVRQLSSSVARIAHGDYEIKTNRFRSREMNELSDAINQMSKTLTANERDHRAQMDRARRIQEHLLPNGEMVPGLAIAHLFQPAEEVAGDYYDLIGLDDGTWLFCLADVAGHGVAAAMGSAMLKSLVLHAAEWHREPVRILQFVNERLPALLPDEYVSMFLARWNPENQQLEYASAGHEPGLLISASGKIQELLATGLMLGIDPTARWETKSLDFSPPQRLILMTDGIAEASDPEGKLFGRQRLAEIISNCVDLSPTQAIELIQIAVMRHQVTATQTDDMTILLIDAALHESSNTADVLSNIHENLAVDTNPNTRHENSCLNR